MKQINVEEIMAQIRMDCEKREKNIGFEDKWDITRVDETDDKELQSLLAEMQRHMTLIYYNELHGNKFKVFIKRVIRKCCAFLIIPMINEQNAFNQSLYALCEKIIDQINADNEGKV